LPPAEGGDSGRSLMGYSAYWIGQIARRYNTEGPDGVRDRRHATCAGQPDCQLHTWQSWERPWLDLILRETAGADGPQPPGSAGASDARSVGNWAGVTYDGSAPAG
jgi:hypothetical protein